MAIDEMPAKVYDEPTTATYWEWETLTAFLEGILAACFKRPKPMHKYWLFPIEKFTLGTFQRYT